MKKSKLDKLPYFISTAIVYPNNRIHVGWAWECIGADWLVRSLKAFGHPVLFSTGMDEHSLNVQRAAEKKGLAPKLYCDEMAKDIEKVLRDLHISFDRFIRTSDADHEKVVIALIEKAERSGDIYKGKFEGHYCESCEAYYTEKELLDGLCPEHLKPVKWYSEENYFFKLSKYGEKIIEWIENNPEALKPDSRKSEILNFVREGLRDFSVSRSSFTWGIPLPFDQKQVIYVWFDALINYLTACGVQAYLDDPESAQGKEFLTYWKNAVHIVGRDINRFHTVYWPAMLMSLGLPPPKQVFVHGWLSLKGERMSKSSGHFVTPDEVMAISGPDPLRYYLLSENQFGGDGNFSWESFILKANADLANDWGNLVNRTISMARKYFTEEKILWDSAAFHAFTLLPEFKVVLDSFSRFTLDLEAAVRERDTVAYTGACKDRSRTLNLFIDQMKPWKLAKDSSPEAMAQLRAVLFVILEGIRYTATGLLPVLPDRIGKVFDQLGVQRPDLEGCIAQLEWGKSQFALNLPEPIYPRIELGLATEKTIEK